jgi:putative membrane protein
VSGPVETPPARTALAWQRTGLGLLLVAGLLARSAAVRDELLLVVPAAVVAVAGLVVLGVLGPRRQRSTDAAARTGRDVRSPGAAAVATGLVVLTAVCALGAELAVRS